MALSEKTISQFAKLLKIDKVKLEAALKSEEVQEVEIQELLVFTQTDIETRDRNQYEQGKEVGLESWVKAKKSELGLEFTGKDPEKLIDAVKAKAAEESGKAPDEKLKEKDTVIEGLRRNLTEKDTVIDGYKKREEIASLDNSILASIPETLPAGITKTDALAIIKNNLEFSKQENGEYQVKRNGEIMRDTTSLSTLSIGDATKSFVKEKKWDEVTDPGKQGRGGGSDKTPAAVGKLSELQEQYKAEGKSINGAEFNAHVQKLIKENPTFEMDV